jgi:hypothetical protein
MNRFFRSVLIRPLPALLLLALVTSGCNVFESLYTEGESNDPKVLLQDAAAAIRKNEPAKAVTILEKAFQKEPDNPKVRVELASALLAANNIDVLDIVALYENISKDVSGSAGTGAFSKTANHCTFNDATIGTPAVRTFDPSYRGLQDLLSKAPVIARVVTLVQPILPAALTATPYDVPEMTRAQAQQFAAGIKTATGLTDAQVANLLLINATATIIQIYNDMFFNTPGVSWYLVKGPTGNEYVGACATSITVVKAKAACQLPKLQGAANSLFVRGVLVGGEAATLANEFNVALTKLETELGTGATCAG